MVPGAHGYSHLVQKGSQIVVVDALRQYGNDGVVRHIRGQHGQLRHGLQSLHGHVRELLFMSGDVVQPQPGYVVHGGGHGDGSFNVGGACLIFEGDIVVNGFFKGDFLDHFAAAHPRRELLQKFPLSPQGADSGGSVQLVAGKGVKIAAKFLNVDFHVGDGLRTVYQNDSVRPVLFG